jgi:hypothetical protein
MDTPIKKNDSNNYVDNKRLYEAIIEYKQSVLEASKANKPKPPISNYIGHCILMIATRLSTKPNFVNYSYREEMISDGIENCICYFDNFDPSKTKNPFAYFTQIIYYAFLRRILKEKKQLYIKHKTLENSLLLHSLVEQGEMSDVDITPTIVDLDNDNMFDFIKSFEDNLLSKKKKKSKKGIEKFIEESEEGSIN